MRSTRLLLLLSIVACDRLEPDRGAPGVEGIRITDEGNGVHRLEVDASDKDAWVYFDLASKTEVDPPADLASSLDWDLAFRRFFVKTNGGVSGPGDMRVAPIANVTFDEVTRAPESGWIEDRPKEGESSDAPDEVIQDDVDYTFNRENAASEEGWYLYDSVDHTLSPAPVIYALESLDGTFYKLEFLRYYDDAGSPAILTLRFAAIDPPDDRPGISVDASAGWVHLSIENGAVEVADPGTSLDWDLAINRVRMRTNGGSSGGGRGGAAWAVEGAAFDEVETVSTIGFTVDADLPIPGPPGSGHESQNPTLSGWYDYDPSTHAVSPKDRVLLIRGASGVDYGKLEVLEYSAGKYRLELAPVNAAALPVERTITATIGDAWVHLDLRSGAIVEPDTPEEDLSWDVAFSRARARTNGGTSGIGMGAVLEVDAPSIAAVAGAPADGYVEDAMLPNPGPPGSGEFSGNPVLNGWYDYDPATHQLSLREVVFVVRTANGDFTKLEVLSYDDGVYSISWAYAGPERTAF